MHLSVADVVRELIRSQLYLASYCANCSVAVLYLLLLYQTQFINDVPHGSKTLYEYYPRFYKSLRDSLHQTFLVILQFPTNKRSKGDCNHRNLGQHYGIVKEDIHGTCFLRHISRHACLGAPVV